MIDPDEELVAALRLLGDLLKKSAAADLGALLSGESKLVIVPKSWRPPPVRTTKAASGTDTDLPPVATVRAQLVDATSSDARTAILRRLNMTQAQAKKLATGLGVKGVARATTDQAIDKIVAYFADSAYAVEHALRA